MKNLSPEDNTRIAAAVARAESATAGEIVIAVIPESDDYAAREMLVAAAAGALAFIVASFFSAGIQRMIERWFWQDFPALLPLSLGILGMAVALLAYILIQIPSLDRFVIGKSAMAEAVRRRAMRHFAESAVYDTMDRTGVLLFVSLLERRVELIADRGINALVVPDTWDRIVSALTRGIREESLLRPLETAIGDIGAILAEHVPPRPDDVNEKPDTPAQLQRGS